MPAKRGEFGRVPLAVYAIVGLAGAAAILSGLAAFAPWYTNTGVLHESGINISYIQNYTPGNGGDFFTCTQYVTSNYTSCGITFYTYSSGNGTQLLSSLYLVVFGTAITTAVLAGACAATITSGIGRQMRARRLQIVVVVLLVGAIGVCAVGTGALPALQSRALDQSNACPDESASNSPCTTFFGQAAQAGCTKTTCLETNLTWHPTTGWFESIGVLGLLVGALALLRVQPIAGSCPSCGGLNVWTATFCDRCGSPLPLAKPTRPPRMKI